MTGVDGAAVPSAAASGAPDAHASAPPESTVGADVDALVGAPLAAVLAAVDPATLDDHDLLELIGAFERLASWTAAGQVAAAAEFARRPARIDVAAQHRRAQPANYAPLGVRVREFADT